MANEDKKDFNAMLHDSKDMPKFQIIIDQKSIEKYGGNKMYFAPPIDYDKVMKKVPYGKVITVGKIREHFAKLSGADFTEPITAGIFVSIVAWASYQRSEDETPYWRTLKTNRKYPTGLYICQIQFPAGCLIKALSPIVPWLPVPASPFFPEIRTWRHRLYYLRLLSGHPGEAVFLRNSSPEVSGRFRQSLHRPRP